jgi:hypothetical protein
MDGRARPPSPLYEWRDHEAEPGRIPDLVTAVTALRGPLHHLGVTTLGTWVEEIGEPGRVSVLWCFADLSAREAALGELAGHPALADDAGLVFERRTSLLATTPYSPTPATPSKLIELRTYEPCPGRAADLDRRFADATIALFVRHGMAACGWWHEAFGDPCRLVYVLGFDDLGHRQTAWRAFSRDPDWRAAHAASEQNGPLVTRRTSRILYAVGGTPT